MKTTPYIFRLFAALIAGIALQSVHAAVLFTAGYSYTYHSTATAAAIPDFSNQGESLLESGAIVEGVSGPKNDGTSGPTSFNTVEATRDVAAGDPIIGQVIGLRLSGVIALIKPDPSR